ncbi:hypothetical protein [Falsiroseomonas sp.]|uniref:hypothetical protein n=1 Tax=Falsiroseomonas sp. TaxID=2870721 RepID=UPI003F6F0CF0
MLSWKAVAGGIARLLSYFVVVQLFKLVFALGAARGEAGWSLVFAGVASQLAGWGVAVAWAVALGRRDGRRWSRDVARIGEEAAAARGRRLCEALACIGILAALPSAYALGAALGEGFVVPFAHALAAWLLSFVLVVLAYMRALHRLRGAATGLG